MAEGGRTETLEIGLMQNFKQRHDWCGQSRGLVSMPGVCAQPREPIVGGRHPHGLGHERAKYLRVSDAVERRRCGLQPIWTDV